MMEQWERDYQDQAARDYARALGLNDPERLAVQARTASDKLGEGQDMRTMNVRRAQSVVWLSDEMMVASDDGGRSEAEAVMRAKVLGMDLTDEERGWIRLVSIRKLTPLDPEFDRLGRIDGTIPDGCSAWVSVWEVRPDWTT